MDEIKQHRWVLVMHIPVRVQRNEDKIGNMRVPIVGPPQLMQYPSYTICFDCKLPYDEGWGNACWSDPDERMNDELWRMIG